MSSYWKVASLEYALRIISFLPSATEIIFALGLGDSLVGVTHECDYPAVARLKPRLVNSFIETAGLTSDEIDVAVKERYQSGQPLYEIDTKILSEAQPELAITQGLCDVCAIPSEQVNTALSSLNPVPHAISLDPHSLDDMFADIQRIGEAADVADEARKFTNSLVARRDSVIARASLSDHKPRVACLEWLDPLLVAGHWVPEMVSLAGGQDCLGKAGEPSFKVEWSDVMESDPDFILAMPCGFDVKRAIPEIPQLTDRPGWNETKAAIEENLFVLDGGSYFSRSGPRLIDGLEMIAEILHPDFFSGLIPQRGAFHVSGELFRVS